MKLTKLQAMLVAVRLLSLTLEQFRNYTALQVDLSPDLHLFIGPNGSGKTNILEAISVLALSKSFLGMEEQDVTQWGESFYRVRGTVRSDDGEEKTLEVVSQNAPRRQKACFVNDVRVAVSEFVGQLPAVMFLPQDLQLFSGPPAERRRFLDQILCQVLPEYFQALLEYQKLLKQRNALLRSIRDERALPEDLDVWDGKLAVLGGILRSARLELIETFGLSLAAEIQSLGERWEDVSVRYERDGQERSAAGIAQELTEQLLACRTRDILLQSTTAGPHRDDWRFMADGHDLATFGSRGQQRTCALALTVLEASYLELRRGEKPIILLDDIFSEFDDAHREAVLHSFDQHQMFLTSTHVPPGADHARIWEVQENRLRPMELRIEN